MNKAEKFINNKLGDKNYTKDKYPMYRKEIAEWLNEFTEVVKESDSLHNVSNSLTYDELKEIINKSCDIEDFRKYIDHKLG